MASIRKRGKKWQYRISYIDPITNKRLEVSKGGFDTKAEAKTVSIEHEAKLNNGEEVVAKNELLKDYLQIWLKEYKKDNVRKNTYLLHQRNVDNHIAPYFKSIKLKDLTHLRHQKFINHLADKGYSSRTIELVHITLSNAMRIAVSPLGKIAKNPCTGAIIPKRQTRKKKGELEFIESNQIATFLKVARKDNYIYWIFFKTLIFTGMRKGEAAALQWNDIDFIKKTIDINKSLDFQPEEENDLFGETKTYDSRRVITMSDELLNDFKKHKQYIEQNKEVFEDGYMIDLDLLFCRQDGSPLPKSTLFNAFNRITSNAEIEKLPIHSTRHTHAVLLLESGATMKFIQERLGHKTMAVTSDTYSHISKKLESESMDNFSKYMDKLTTTEDKD